MKPFHFILPFFVVLVFAQSIMAGNTASVDPAGELQDAALNYEDAAKAQLSLANGLLRARLSTRHEEEDDRLNLRKANAALELQAAEQLMAAAANLDHATRAWHAAAQAASESASRDFFRRAGRDAQQRATSLMRRAAELAEHAALEFGATADLQQKANASHRAGRIREQLAGRY